MLLLEVWARGVAVGEAIVGAVVGIAVSVLVAPPLYVRAAGEAIGELAHRMADLSRGFAGGLRGSGWSPEAADHWLREVRALRTDVVRVDQAVAQAEESARLHPRAHITLRTIARAVLDRTFYMPEDEQQDTYTTRQRAALADVLITAAAAIDAVAPIAGADDPQRARSRGACRARRPRRTAAVSLNSRAGAGVRLRPHRCGHRLICRRPCNHLSNTSSLRTMGTAGI